MKILCINCKPDLSYFEKRGLPFEVEYKTINEKFPLIFIKSALGGNGNMIKFYSPFPAVYLEQQYKKFQFSIILVGYKQQDYGKEANNTGGYTHEVPLSCGTFWSAVRQDEKPENNYAVHEIHHALVYILNVNFKLNHSNATMVRDWMDVDKLGRAYYLNDFPENSQSNYAQTWEQLKPHLPDLLSIKYAMTYKYFKESEVVGLKPELVRKLDLAREYAGVPFKINSGFRTPEENAKLQGSVEDSAHLTGLAADIACLSSEARWKMLQGALQAGFKRIGIGATFLHLDVDTSKVQEVIFSYYK